MRIGVQLPEVERAVRWPEYRALARAAEESGFDSIWVGDHLLYRSPERAPWEVWTLLSALAAVTSLLAKMAATIDEVSGGRVVLGLGAGWNRDEFDAFGIPFDKRVSRFEEAFAIIRRLLAGERVTLAGTFASADDAVLRPAPARSVPLMIGSNGPRMLRATLPHVAAWNTWYTDYGNTAEGFAALDAQISAAAEDVGRAPAEVERSACVHVVLDAASRERPIEVPPVTGTPAQIAARLRELAEAGADEAILVVTPITEASIRSLANVVG